MVDIKLKIDNEPDFVKQFIEKTKGLSPDIVAKMVWELANERWTNGYNKGYYNPHYENEDDE